MSKKFFAFALGLLVSAGLAFAQRGEITGVVTDASSGEGIPFASIMEKGTMNGISSEADGTYRIRVSDMSKAVLVFSSVGYNSLEIPVDGRAVINIALATDNVLDDVIVVVLLPRNPSRVPQRWSSPKTSKRRSQPTLPAPSQVRLRASR